MMKYCILLFLAAPMMAAAQERTATNKQTLKFSSEEEAPEPPPPSLKSTFTTVNQWLSAICDGEKPGKAIAQYNIGLWKSGHEYTLAITGENKEQVGANASRVTIDYAPSNGYYKLPVHYYKGLTHARLLQKLSAALQAFAGSSQFRQSFLSKAERVVFSPTGMVLWTRQ